MNHTQLVCGIGRGRGGGVSTDGGRDGVKYMEREKYHAKMSPCHRAHAPIVTSLIRTYPQCACAEGRGATETNKPCCFYFYPSTLSLPLLASHCFIT